MGRMEERCGSVRGVRGGSTVGGRVRRGIGLGIGVIVWRGEWGMTGRDFALFRNIEEETLQFDPYPSSELVGSD